jgi:hypothetical protein
MPIIWLLPEAASPSASVQLDGESFGPVSPGMSLSQASEALGLPIEIDHNLLPKPRCLAAVIVGDPYSPFFVVVGGSDPAKSEIVEIENNLGDHSCS